MAAKKKKKQKLVTKEINFLLLALAFILAVGIIATKKYNPTKQIAEVIENVEVETSNSETRKVNAEIQNGLYINHSDGFTFEYPTNYFINPTFNNERSQFSSGSKIIGEIAENNLITLRINIMDDAQSYEYFSRLSNIADNNSLYIHTKIRELESSNYSGYVYTANYNQDKKGETEANYWTNAIILLRDGRVITLNTVSNINTPDSITARSAIIDKALNTLEFPKSGSL